jgi:hypothetical protein
MLRSFLLAPCLLVCLACATPLPIENLEQGMTTEAVREDFGEPQAIDGDNIGSVWRYTHEEQNWVGTAYCTLFAPGCALMSPFTLLGEGETAFHLVGVDERPLVLYFEANKLNSWVLLDAPTWVSTDQDTMPYGWMTVEEWTRDFRYHYHRGGTHEFGDPYHEWP